MNYYLFFYTSNINTAFPTLLWPNNQHQSAIRCLDPPRKETWKHGRISDRMCESDILLARGTLSRQHATSGIGSSWTSQAYTPVRTGKAKVIYHQPELVNTMQLHFFMQFFVQQKSELFFFWTDFSRNLLLHQVTLAERLACRQKGSKNQPKTGKPKLPNSDAPINKLLYRMQLISK